MKTKNILILFSLFVLSACQGIKTNQAGGTGSFKKGALEKAQNQFCSKGQSLQILENGTDALVTELSLNTKIFGFSKEDGDCLPKSIINDSWMQNGVQVWFTMNPNSENNCIKNNSLWEVTNSSQSGSGQYFYLRSLDDPSQRLMEMNAHISVRGTYAKDKLGLTLFVCKF
jgi:hypothetical protein